MILGILFVAASNYFSVKIPQEIREALDYVQQSLREYEGGIFEGNVIITEETTRVLLIFAGTVIGLAILQGVMMYFMRQTIIVMSRLIEYDLRTEIYDHLQNLDLAYFKRNKTGDIMSRITEDVNKVRMYLGPCLLYGINLLSLFTLAIYAMFSVNTKLTLFTLLPLPFLSISIYWVSKRINKKSTEIQTQLGVLTSDAQEVYSGIRVVKSYVKESQFLKFFDRESEDYKRLSIGLARINAMFFPLMFFMISISTLLVVYVGGLEVAAGNVTPGNIAEFVIYVNMLTWPVTSIGWIASLVQEAEASQKRINNLLSETPEISEEGTLKDPIEGKIEFRNVSFTYQDTGIQALEDVSFTIHPGDKVAILGRTAAGKSTIVDLLLRLYDVDQGEIYLDDKNIESFDLSYLREQIGYVPQDVFLFSDTIANNIKFGTETAGANAIAEYAHYASIGSEIEELPYAYETRVGERGVSLSGGQKQRISISRAFIKDPDIVILDDALSAVDTDTEQRIMRYLNEALRGKTSINITHRMHNMEEYDLIILIEDGKVTASGNHLHMLNTSKYYAEMVEQQSLQDLD